MKRIITIVAAAFLCLQANAQILDEPFNSPSTSALTAVGWTQIGAVTTNPILISSPGLNFAGYKSNAVNNAASLTTTGQDVLKDASASISSGSLYAAALVNVSAAQAAGDYFLALLPSGSTTAFTGRLFVRLSSAGYYKIGVSKFAVGANEAVNYSVDSFSFNTTYAVVMKYQFNTGSTTDDTVKVFVFDNTFPGTEPATVNAQSIMINPVTDAANLSRIALRQGNAANAATLKVDGILMTTSWSDLVSTAALPPSPVSNLTLTGITKSTAEVTWNYPTLYIDSTTSILVFAKKDSAINQGTPTLSTSTYSANSDLTTPGTPYQNDSAAVCVYKGDAAGFTLTGMQADATYHLLSFIATDADSLYSTAVTANGTSSAKPARISGLQLVRMGQANLLAKWTNPSAYTDSSYTTLVFLKADSAITGSPMQPWAGGYVANSNLSDSSSDIETDKSAHCVFNGDTNAVYISGLEAGRTYYAVVYTFREVDSTYSLPENANGSTEGLIPEPKAILSPVATEISHSYVKFEWAHDTDYADSLYTTLVFAKAGSAVQTGANTIPPAQYADITSFGNGTKYENDTNAFCIFKGDTTKVTLLNLAGLTSYHLLYYVVRDSDNVYSAPTVVQATTIEAPPAGVSDITITGTSQTTARVQWTKPVGYQNNRHTVLVFLKAGAINLSTINQSIIAYQANSLFGLGTPYDTDSLAYCVYTGDTTFVNITGLSSNTSYQAVVYVMRDADSVESVGYTSTGNTQGAPPMYTIGSINTTNPTTGVADSTGVRVTVTGTVYGFNQRATGLQCLLKDATGGITLFNASKNFGYTITQGDKLEAEGVVTTFRGLNQLTLDTIRFVSSANSIVAPRKVQLLNETTENDLVKLDSVRFVTTPVGGVWPSTSSNIRVITPANDTLTVRVLSTSGLAGKPLPATTLFNIAGMGSQNTTTASAPFPFTGYQLLPRTEGDVADILIIVADSLPAFHLLTPGDADTIVVNASNLSETLTISWTNTIHSNGVDPTAYTFILDTLGGDFGNPYDELDNGSDTMLVITKQDIKDLIIDPLQIPQGGWFAGLWQVRAVAGSILRNSEETYSIYIVNDIATGLSETQLDQSLTLWPNPAHGYTNINGLLKNDKIEVLDITGRVVFTQVANETFVVVPTLDLNAGIYFVRVQSGSTSVTRKLVVQ
jgi:DNA/RNA endonuclease YhcR with UshA esterase domain